MLTAVVVEDHEAARDGVLALLRRDTDVQPVEAVRDGENAVRCVREVRPDICLMDLRLPGLSGGNLTAAVLEASPATKVVVYTGFDGPVEIAECLAAGAVGYLSKALPGPRLGRALELIADGAVVIDFPAPVRAVAQGSTPGHSRGGSVLTARERQFLVLAAAGSRNADIARECGVSERTVKNAMTNVMRKLGAPNRTAASRIAQDLGLL